MRRWVIGLAAAVLFGFATMASIKLGQQPDGSFLVSSGQRIELIGKATRLEGARPKDLAPSPDESLVAVLAHNRIVITDPAGNIRAQVGVSPGPLGIGWSPDGKTIYTSLANGHVGTFRWDGIAISKGPTFNPAPPGTRSNPGTCGIAVRTDGAIYVALSIANEVVALSPVGAIEKVWKVGACPYNLRLSSDGSILAVANRGGTVVAPPAEQTDPDTNKPFMGTGVANALSAGTAVQVDPRTDAALTGTVTIIKTKAVDEVPKSVSVGRGPSGMAFSVSGQNLFVADSDEDCVSIVDVHEGKELRRMPLAPQLDPGFGQIPTSLGLSRDGERLFVCLGGANAIADLKLQSNRSQQRNGDLGGPVSPMSDNRDVNLSIQGYIPTGWYPIDLLTSFDGLYVACAKGIGSRPSSKTTGFGVHDSVGVIQSIGFKEIRNLSDMTRRVARNNNWTKSQAPRKNQLPVPVPERLGEPSVFKHVIYIVKENLTYDIAMGDIKEGNGDPSLCTFPENVTPNHHALARRFGLLDNFYISGTNSADGHQWVDSSIANGYTEQNYAANQRSYPYDGGDPLAFSPAGFLWSQARLAGKSVRVFGEFVDKPSIVDSVTGRAPDWKRCWDDYKSGKGEVQIKAETSEAGLRECQDPVYIGFPLNVSDQWRADRFLGEFNKWESTGSMPSLSILLLPCDHTGGTRPGWPTPRAEVADNDYALGRIVEAVSKSKDWADTLIIVAEDDSQNGLDHVDGHRSIAFCISAYSLKGAVIEDLYNHVSIASTIGRILGFPPMTRFDRTQKPLYACFGEKPDLNPYIAAPNRIPLDELNPPARKAGSSEAVKLAEECAKMDWQEPDVQDQNVLNRAIWMSEAKRSVGRAGYSTEYPTSRFK